MKKIISTNQGKNFEKIGEIVPTTDKEIAQKVARANIVKQKWADLGAHKRITHVKRLKEELKKRSDEIALMITKEVGTPITECNDEVAWDWGYFEWFIENVEKSIADEVVSEDQGSIHTVRYEPIGTAAVITPWNLPFDLFVWGVVPNLLVGNTVVYKASEECVLTGQLLESI